MVSGHKRQQEDAALWGVRLADLLGLEALRPGFHAVRNEKRERLGALWVRIIWHVMVLPSFHDPICVLLASVDEADHFPPVVAIPVTIPQANEMPDEPSKAALATGWTKAAFLCPGGFAVAELDGDPLAACLRTPDLREESGVGVADGIGYEITFRTMLLEGSLTFSNPQTPSLRSLERALFSVGRDLVSRSQDASVAMAFDIWGQYAAST